MWFDNWHSLLRIALVGVAAYAVLMLVLRLTGKRTLSQLNAFDFIVTVSLGSTLATILISTDVAWTEGVAALLLLSGLQFVVAAVSSRWPGTREVFTAHPTLLVSGGEVRREALRSNRLTESELLQVVRMHGCGDVSQVAAVVLEPNGKYSVITADRYGDGSALAGVEGVRER